MVIESSYHDYIAEIETDGKILFVKSDGEIVPESVMYPEIKE